jgi:hypothetical protein
MLSFHLHLRLLIGIFLSGLRIESNFPYLQCVLYSTPILFSLFGLLNNISQAVWIIMYFSVRSPQELLEVQGVRFNENLMLGS